MSAAAISTERELGFKRVFLAPRELVFDAFTDKEHVSNWWGPNGFTTTTYQMDVQPGGIWRFTMHGPDGRDYENRVVYTEVVRPERLVYDHFDEQDLSQPHFVAIVNFESVEGGTEVTLRLLFPTAEAKQAAANYGAIEGGNQTLARFAEHLETVSRGSR